MEYKDYYKTLGVPRTASQSEIRKAYRKLARQHHPDVKPGDKKAEQTFKDLNEANTVLSDPDKRKRYDALGANWDQFSEAGDAAGAGARAGARGAAGGADPFAGGDPFGFGGGGNVRYEFRTGGDAGDLGDLGGFSDFFRMMFGGGAGGPGPTATSGRRTASSADIDDMLAGLKRDSNGPGGRGGAGTQARARPTRATPVLEATAEITLEEAFNGTKRIVQIDDKRLEVTIPRGVDNGSRIRLAGRGGDGADLVVVIRVKPHPVFTRRGADLERELPITLREALLGGEVPVKTLKGRVLLTIPAGTQNGRTFRLSGQGMPRLNADGQGDLYVRTRVVLPTNLTDEQKAAARQFLDLVDQPDPR